MRRVIALVLPAVLMLIMMSSCNPSQAKHMSPKKVTDSKNSNNESFNNANIWNGCYITSVGNDLYYWYSKTDEKKVLVRESKKTKEQKELITEDSCMNSVFTVDSKTLCCGLSFHKWGEATDVDYCGANYILYDIPSGKTQPLVNTSDFPEGTVMCNYINGKYYFFAVNPKKVNETDLTYDLYSTDSDKNITKILIDKDFYVVDTDGIYYLKDQQIIRKDLKSETEKQVCKLPDETRDYNKYFNKYKNKLIYETRDCMHILDLDNNTEVKVIGNGRNCCVFFRAYSLMFDDKYIYSQSRNGIRIEKISYDGKDRRVIYDKFSYNYGIVDNKIYVSDSGFGNTKLYYMNKDGTNINRLKLN